PLQTRPESPPEIPARHPHQGNRHRETPGHRIRARLRLARRQDRKPSGRRNRPARRGTRTVEPRARPAATRGQQPCPHPGSAITETDSRTHTEHEDRNTSRHPKHLKSLVLGFGGRLHGKGPLTRDLAVQPILRPGRPQSTAEQSSQSVCFWTHSTCAIPGRSPKSKLGHCRNINGSHHVNRFDDSCVY